MSRISSAAKSAISSGTHSSYERIYAVVSKVPRGQVATYGQIAELAGLPGHARQVGYALNALPPNSKIPWHRIVNAKGEISLRKDGAGYENLQRVLLEREGVLFGANERISLAQFQWYPGGQGLLSKKTRK